jgi:hypothetical protein
MAPWKLSRYKHEPNAEDSYRHTQRALTADPADQKQHAAVKENADHIREKGRTPSFAQEGGTWTQDKTLMTIPRAQR